MRESLSKTLGREFMAIANLIASRRAMAFAISGEDAFTKRAYPFIIEPLKFLQTTAIAASSR
ncbi:conserved hypothetical protein [Ricinus communis]|uniref:Uncharacterized protein n=1 Tax=Ricinus communis TaxID=3988 RepID=B9S6W4_RICCO|nr:conserved hypothetical protein [Ricinus communis]